MPALLRRALGHLARTLPWTLVTAALLAARIAWPPRDFDAVGPVALRDLGLSLGLWALVLVLSLRLGRRLISTFLPPDVSSLETLILSLAIGIGAIGYALFGLGMAGALHEASITAFLVLLGVWVGPSPNELVRGPGALARALVDAWRSSEVLARAAAAIGIVIALLALLHALAPPWDYDGLMYHLVGPQLFLREGRIVPNPDNWYINAPFTIEMVFSLGMAYGDDVFPKLIHFAMGALLVLATYTFGRRWLGASGGWLSAAILLGVPTLPIWSAFAYIDLGWSLYEFIALAAAVAWWQSRSRRWLWLSAICIGLAMGAKYLGLMGFAVLGIFVALGAIRDGRREWLRSVAGFGVIAALVGAPWYLRNLIWFGNPVFPLYFGGPGWPDERLALYQAYLSRFGTGQRVVDYLLIPWNVYARHSVFGAVMNRIDVPALLFPLLLAYPFLPRRPEISVLLWIALARVALWAFGSQQIRFLVPIYPALAISTAYVAGRLMPRQARRIPWQQFLPMLSVALMLLTLFYQVVLHLENRPALVAVGQESRRDYLERSVRDFAAQRFIEERVEGPARVLLLGDGRGYYCPDRCLPDPDHFRWSAEIAALGGTSDLAGWFADHGLTHVLLSVEDLDFLLQHDVDSIVRTSLDRLLAWRDAGCMVEVFRDEWTALYAVGCDWAVSPPAETWMTSDA